MKDRGLGFLALTLLIGGFLLFGYWYLMTEHLHVDIFKMPWLILSIYMFLCVLFFPYSEKRVSSFILEHKGLDILATSRLSLIISYIFGPIIWIISKAV